MSIAELRETTPIQESGKVANTHNIHPNMNAFSKTACQNWYRRPPPGTATNPESPRFANAAPETFPSRFTVASAATARKSIFIVLRNGVLSQFQVVEILGRLSEHVELKGEGKIIDGKIIGSLFGRAHELGP